MMRHYCTLFDRNYLFKGLALYRSLVAVSVDFTLHILCMDDVTYDLLRQLNLPQARLIRRKHFEDPELLRVKPTRTIAEYCWTCTPSLALYVLRNNPQIDLITYLDADLFFFSSPEPIYKELGDKSILIVEHRLSPHFSEYSVNGKYNVEWLTFRRDNAGLEALHWWRERCLEWCFHRLEDGKLGDQKYLDDWPDRFRGVHVLKHIGGGVAPWNMSSYSITEHDNLVCVDSAPLIFFHFHKFRILTPWLFAKTVPMYAEVGKPPRPIYKRYSRSIRTTIRRVRRADPKFSCGIELVGLRSCARAAVRLAHQASGRLKGRFRSIMARVIRKRRLEPTGTTRR